MHYSICWWCSLSSVCVISSHPALFSLLAFLFAWCWYNGTFADNARKKSLFLNWCNETVWKIALLRTTSGDNLIQLVVIFFLFCHVLSWYFFSTRGACSREWSPPLVFLFFYFLYSVEFEFLFFFSLLSYCHPLENGLFDCFKREPGLL